MSTDIVKHINITVSGRVQGVGYRFAARNIAISLGIRGSIRNLFNGDVFIEAEGSNFALKKFIEWCHKGPSYADVRNVTTEESDIKGYKYLDIVG